MTREEAIETLGHVVPFATQNGEKIAEAIDMAIEALSERPKGEWILSDNPNMLYECSNCGHGFQKQVHGKSVVFYAQNFCPNCGADMRGVR